MMHHFAGRRAPFVRLGCTIPTGVFTKEIKIVVEDKAKYPYFSTREDIKANLQVDLILLLDKYDYPPVTIDDVYKEVLEQAENFKKYQG